MEWQRSKEVRSNPETGQIFLCLYMYLRLSTYLCIYISTYLCIYVSTYLCIYVSTYLHIYISTYLRIYVYLCLSTFISLCRATSKWTPFNGVAKKQSSVEPRKYRAQLWMSCSRWHLLPVAMSCSNSNCGPGGSPEIRQCSGCSSRQSTVSTFRLWQESCRIDFLWNHFRYVNRDFFLCCGYNIRLLKSIIRVWLRN
jgi:hypothetical protein